MDKLVGAIITLAYFGLIGWIAWLGFRFLTGQ
jgi:hypothetical protein